MVQLLKVLGGNESGSTDQYLAAIMLMQILAKIYQH